MGKNRLYVLHPGSRHLPVIDAWISEIEQVIAAEAEWSEWSLIWLTFDDQNAFDVNTVFARVMQRVGPVVLFDCAQTKPRELLRARLIYRSVVCLVTISDSTALWEKICEARDRFLAGEPVLPRKYVAAVLLLRKLIRGKYWGGSHEKNFMWADDLARGRGVPEDLSDVIRQVASDLYQKGLLIAKYGSSGKRRKGQKYALNSDCRHDIEMIASEGIIEDESLQRVLMRDSRTVPRSWLKWDAVDAPSEILGDSDRIHGPKGQH